MQNNLNMKDVPELIKILEKLGVSLSSVAKSRKQLTDKRTTPEEKARGLFSIPEGESLNDFLTSRLNEHEIEVLRRNIGIG